MHHRGDVESAKGRLLAKSDPTNDSGGGARPVGRGRFWEKPHKGQLKNTLDKFNAKAEETEAKEKRNPFSATYVRPQHSIDDEDYGRPEKGSLTEKRGVAAGESISKEIVELCRIITEFGSPTPQGGATITFGQLFDIYTKISNKVVGVLMRARKHGLISFEGEMLFQRRDEAVVITLLRPVAEVEANFGGSGDPARCLAEHKKV